MINRVRSSNRTSSKSGGSMKASGCISDQTYSAEFTILGALTKLPNSRRGEHWGQALHQRKRWGKLIGNFPIFRPEKPLVKAKLVVTRLSTVSKSPDQDNLMASLKPVIDALVSQGFFIDDSMDVLYSEVKWQRVDKRKDQGTLILISGIY